MVCCAAHMVVTTYCIQCSMASSLRKQSVWKISWCSPGRLLQNDSLRHRHTQGVQAHMNERRCPTRAASG